MIGQTAAEELELPASGSEGGRARRPAQSFWSASWEELRGNRIGMAAGVLILLLALAAIAAPLISQLVTHYQPTRQNLDSQFDPPGAAHLLGADEVGRDTLTRLIWGAQVSLGVGFLTVAVQLVVGVGVGLLAGYYGRWADEVLMRLVDMVLAIPGIFLFILMAILFRPNALTLSLIIASVGWGAVARLVRGEVLTVKNRDFVLATKSVGAGDARLLLRHLLPNVLHCDDRHRQPGRRCRHPGRGCP
jgi:peptide/nickel transport system permease protein